jgi:hypothetical protein
VDVNRLSRGERIAGAAAVLLFIDMFLSWYSANISGALSAAASRFNVDTSVSAWQAFSTTDILLLITIVVALAMVGTRAMGRAVNLPVSLPLVVAALGALMTLLVLWRIINQPGPNDFINVEYGAYIGLILIAALTYGAILAGGGVDTMRAEAESLQTRATSGGDTPGPAGETSVAEPAGPPPTAATPAPVRTPVPPGAPDAALDPSPPPPPPTPQPTPPAPATEPPAPAPAPGPGPAPAPPVPRPDPSPLPDREPAPPQPGDDPMGPTA